MLPEQFIEIELTIPHVLVKEGMTLPLPFLRKGYWRPLAGFIELIS